MHQSMQRLGLRLGFKKKKKKIDYLLKIFLDYQLPFFAQEREFFI
jgi:hypothetical protein